MKRLYFVILPFTLLLCFLLHSQVVHAANSYIKNKDFYVYGVSHDADIHFLTINDDLDTVVNDHAWTGGGEITYEWVDATSILVHMINVDCHKYTPWIYIHVPDMQGYHFKESIFGEWTGTGCAGTAAHYTGAAYIMDATVQQYIGAQFGYSSVTFLREPNTYYIHYDGNGNTSGTMDLQSATYDQAVNLLPNAYTKSISCSFQTNGGSAVSTISGNATFLHWTRDYQTYAPGSPVLNLSSANEDVVRFQAVWGNTTITLPATSRTGYRFSGWYDASGRFVGNAGTRYAFPENTTLYARWTPINYSITYHSNGVGDSNVYKQTLTYDTTDSIRNSMFSQAGFVFLHWNTSPDGTGQTYNVGQTIRNLYSTEGQNLDLYAIWDTDFTLQLNGNGGALGDGKTDIFMEHVTNETTLPEYCFGMENYSQQGWSLNPSDFYYDDTVYYVEDSIHKYHSSAAAFLLHVIHTRPDLVSVDESGCVTVLMYAIWDEFPSIEASDIYLTSDELAALSESDLIEMLLDSSHVTITDREDASDPTQVSNWNRDNIPLQEVSIYHCDWEYLRSIGTANGTNDPADSTDPTETTETHTEIDSAENSNTDMDSVEDSKQVRESGATTVTYRVVDFCDNVTECNIFITVTSSNPVRSSAYDGALTPIYARYISMDYLDTLDCTSKWVLDDAYKRMLNKALGCYQ